MDKNTPVVVKDEKASAKPSAVAAVKQQEKSAPSVHEELLALAKRYRAEYGSTGVTRLGYEIDGSTISVDLTECGFCITVTR